MIRKFEIKDLSAVMNLWLKTNIQTHNFIPKQYWINHFDMVKQIIPTAEVFVYEHNNIIKAFIGIDHGYLAGIFVNDKVQSRGIGKQLLERAKEQYCELNLTVYQKNSKAIQFYLREGFAIEQQKIDENTKEDEFTMQWKK